MYAAVDVLEVGVGCRVSRGSPLRQIVNVAGWSGEAKMLTHRLCGVKGAYR